MSAALSSWQFWAVLSALFAALTAIFAKVGVEHDHRHLSAGGHFDRDQWFPKSGLGPRQDLALSYSVRARHRRVMAVLFRALKIGQAAQVAPIDKLSVVLVAIFGVAFLGEKLTLMNWIGVALISAGAIFIAF